MEILHFSWSSVDLEERFCVLSLKLFPHYLFLSHAYESNSNKGIEEACKRGMPWFRLRNTTAFIQKDVYGCADNGPALGCCTNTNTKKWRSWILAPFNGAAGFKPRAGAGPLKTACVRLQVRCYHCAVDVYLKCVAFLYPRFKYVQSLRCQTPVFARRGGNIVRHFLTVWACI